MSEQKEVYSIAMSTISITNMQQHLVIAKEKGADIVKFDFSCEPNYAYSWIRFYKTISDEELKQEKIKRLELELSKLRS